MTFPTYDQLMLPLMKLLSEQQEAIKFGEMATLMAERSGLSVEELGLRLSSGTKTIFYDRVGWAKTYLVKAGLINQPKRGFCELSEIGRQLDLSRLTNITIEFLMKYESFSNYKLGILKENQEIQCKVDDVSNIQKLEETRVC